MIIFFRSFSPKDQTLLRSPLRLFCSAARTCSAQPSVIRTHEDDSNVISVVDCLHRGLSWKTLAEQLASVEFTDPLVEKILLQLKEPINSRKALNFFHWSGNRMQFQHGISNYCVTIHILVKGGLVKDAKALLESVLGKYCRSDCDSQIFIILDSLVDSYEVVDSVPLVFDLFVQTCAKLRMLDRVLDACKLLSDLGFQLSVISFNTLLHVMQKSEKCHLVWGVYEHMIDSKIFPNEVTMRIMVSALCKEGKLERLLDIVDRMQGKRCSVPRIIVNTCLVYELIAEERIEKGLKLLKWMLQKNMILDTISYSLVVFAKLKMGNVDAAEEVYGEMLKRGFQENAFVCGLFVEKYCEEGKIDDSIRLFEEMEKLGLKPSLDTFTHLIKGCSLNERFEDCLIFCKKMINKGFVPDSLVINDMFEKLCENGEVKRADEMLTVLLDKGFTPNVNTFSHLISGYDVIRNIEGLMKIVYEMEYRSITPNMSSFDSVIANLCKFERVEEAEKYLERMKACSFVPNANTYERLIDCHLQKGNKTRAHQLYAEKIRS